MKFKGSMLIYAIEKLTQKLVQRSPHIRHETSSAPQGERGSEQGRAGGRGGPLGCSMKSRAFFLHHDVMDED